MNSSSNDYERKTTASNGDSETNHIPGRLKVLLIFIVMISCGLIVVTAKNYFLFLTMPEGKKISLFWERDYKMLQQRNFLPPEAGDLRSFKIIATSELTKKWSKDLQVPFSTKKKGKYKMEVLLMGMEEPEWRGAVIEMNITSINDDNHVWELGRTYSLKLTPMEVEIHNGIKKLLASFDNESTIDH